MKDTPLDFPLSWMRSFISLTLMHSTATSPLYTRATIDSLTAKPTTWFPFFSYFPPSAPEQNTTYPAAVKALCPSRLTSCNPMTSQPASSQVFIITSSWPTPFAFLIASDRTFYVPTTSSPALTQPLHLCKFCEQTYESSCVSSSSSEPPFSSIPIFVFPRQSISPSPSPFAKTGSCLSANVTGAAVPTRNVHHLPDFGAYSRDIACRGMIWRRCSFFEIDRS